MGLESKNKKKQVFWAQIYKKNWSKIDLSLSLGSITLHYWHINLSQVLLKISLK